MTDIDLSAAVEAALWAWIESATVSVTRENVSQRVLDINRHRAEAAIRAALPLILAQVETRVTPSWERLTTAIALEFEGCGEAWIDDSSGDRLASVAADAVLTLLPGKTEQEVREEVAREHEEKMDRLLEGEWQAGYVAGNNDQLNGTICGRRRAANEGIARGGAGCGQCHRVDGTHKLDCTARGGEQT